MHTARLHLNFACQLYELQHRQGRVFIHEHPQSARSWAEDSIQKLLKIPGVSKYQLDLCRFNLMTRSKAGEGLAKKPTTILTNSAAMGEYLARKCEGGHVHMPLIGGDRATRAAVYTPELCQAIVEGIQNPQSEEITEKEW